jgi:hypothetical protein
MIFFFEFLSEIISTVKRICPRVPTSRPFQRSADQGLRREPFQSTSILLRESTIQSTFMFFVVEI